MLTLRKYILNCMLPGQDVIKLDLHQPSDGPSDGDQAVAFYNSSIMAEIDFNQCLSPVYTQFEMEFSPQSKHIIDGWIQVQYLGISTPSSPCVARGVLLDKWLVLLWNALGTSSSEINVKLRNTFKFANCNTILHFFFPMCIRVCFGDHNTTGCHLEGWDVLYNIIFCYIANFLLHNRNFFGYKAFNLMLYNICYITYAT